MPSSGSGNQARTPCRSWSRRSDRPVLSAGDRAMLVRNIGRLDRSAVPPLIATLDSGDARLVADAADALGRIGDPRAVPHLTYLAARNPATSAVGAAARAGIERADGPAVRVAAPVSRSPPDR